MKNQHHAGQKWRIIYELKGDDAYTKDGVMSKKGYNMKANEPFLFRSKMSHHRVVECYLGSNIVIKKYKKGNKGQLWRFDPISKTIRNLNWTKYVISMEPDVYKN
jgi:hypothetical protein